MARITADEIREFAHATPQVSDSDGQPIDRTLLLPNGEHIDHNGLYLTTRPVDWDRDAGNVMTTLRRDAAESLAQLWNSQSG